MKRWLRHSSNVPLTGDGHPIHRHQVANPDASWSTNGTIHVYADNADGERLIWDMDLYQARDLLVALRVIIDNHLP